jgi:DNA end-binding protein Ku
MAASVWRGRITFGLVSIPVRLIKAARRERTRFRRVQRVAAQPQLDEEPDLPEVPVIPFRGARSAEMPPAEPDLPANEDAVVRVRNAPVSGMADLPVQPSEILKGYEVAKDEFVVLDPDEVAALRPRTSSELEISEFVRLKEIDPVYLETSYYVIPEAGGEKPYALLFETLKQTGHAGIGALAMHGRNHIALIRPGREAMVLHSMFYANEVSRPAYALDPTPADARQLEMAKKLVGALETRFEPEKWRDRYEESLKELIESRTPAPSPSVPAAGAARAPVVDILEALKKSLERARKPVASEKLPAKTRRPAAKRR